MEALPSTDTGNSFISPSAAKTLHGCHLVAETLYGCPPKEVGEAQLVALPECGLVVLVDILLVISISCEGGCF